MYLKKFESKFETKVRKFKGYELILEENLEDFRVCHGTAGNEQYFKLTPVSEEELLKAFEADDIKQKRLEEYKLTEKEALEYLRLKAKFDPDNLLPSKFDINEIKRDDSSNFTEPLEPSSIQSIQSDGNEVTKVIKTRINYSIEPIFVDLDNKSISNIHASNAVTAEKNRILEQDSRMNKIDVTKVENPNYDPYA